MLLGVGKKTPCVGRFSTTGLERGSSEAIRDVKGRIASEEPRSSPVVEKRPTQGVFFPTPSSMSMLHISEISSVT
jgi:hypothetical protein